MTLHSNTDDNLTTTYGLRAPAVPVQPHNGIRLLRIRRSALLGMRTLYTLVYPHGGAIASTPPTPYRATWDSLAAVCDAVAYAQDPERWTQYLLFHALGLTPEAADLGCRYLEADATTRALTDLTRDLDVDEVAAVRAANARMRLLVAEDGIDLVYASVCGVALNVVDLERLCDLMADAVADDFFLDPHTDDYRPGDEDVLLGDAWEAREGD